MSIRKAHGSAAARGVVAVVEQPPLDELASGQPAKARQAAPRDEQGRLLPGPGTSEQARRAAQASAESRQLKKLLGLRQPVEGAKDYLALVSQWRDEYLRHLAQNIGAGSVPPDAAMLASNAARMQAGAILLNDLAFCSEELETKECLQFTAQARSLADSAKQQMLAAYELTARAGKLAGAAKPQAAEPQFSREDIRKIYNLDKLGVPKP